MKIMFIATIAFLCGVAAFVVLLMLLKGGSFAVKRKKTKLGLVKVAGAGLKLEDEEGPEGSDGQSGDAGRGAAGINTDNEASGVGADVGANTNTNEAGVAGNDVAAASPSVGAVSDEPDGSGEDAENQETLAVPTESVNEEDDGVSTVPPPPKQSANGGDKRDSGESKPSGEAAVRRSESRPFGEKLPMIDDGPAGSVGPVRKIVDLPVENPFLSGRSPASGGGHDKKTTTPQRRRLPETVKMKDRKVILAEDVAINRDLIAMYFDGSGVKFEFAVNGREVCEKFERDPGGYSLILMDIQMPEMDGYEVSRKIRSMDVDWAKQIPIIAMTGNDQKEDIDLCFEAGMDDHIPKPIDMEVLQDKVFDILTLNAESF